MEAVLQTKGLLSLPPTPKARALYPSQGFKQRLFATKPKTFSGFSLSSNEVPKLPILVSKPNGFLPKDRNLHICRAEAAADGQALFGEETDKPKFLGIELVTFKKIIALGLMFFCILFNYTILRDTKDVLVVTAKGSSAEIIPFLKTWVNLPMAIGFMVLYTKLANVLSKQALFYTVIFPFIAFFGVFGFVLYPLSSYIHPEAFADRLLNVLGPRFLGPLAIMRIWTFCLFYVMAELWGSVVVSVLFWGFANQITSVDEAKRFYPLFGLGANVALIFSGRTVKYFSNLRTNLGPGVDGWAVSLKGMMSIVVLMGLAICLCYWWVNAYVPLPTRSMKKKEKPKMSTMESLKFLVSSRYIRDLATLVVAYGISINLVEVTWKSKLKAQFPSPNEYSAFMGDFSTATGIATFTMMLLSQFIFEKYGWGAAAKITPTVLLLTGVGFFSLILFGGPLAPTLTQFGMTPLLAAVYVGAMQNIFSKSAKYSLFDPCKEMAYIPLDEDTKVKGKAAIDVVCNPLGKSGLVSDASIIGGFCLDGSLPAYHLHRGFGAGASNWLLQFEGGGWCNDIQSCLDRAKTKRGSSLYMNKLEDFNGILSNDASLNPDFYNWNRVKLRYCDGGSFSGDAKFDNGTSVLYFRGQKIWEAIILDLLPKGLGKADKANLLSGCSAGGLSSFLQCENFYRTLPTNTTVKCLSDAGFFLDERDITLNYTMRTFFENLVSLQGIEKNLDKNCTSFLDNPKLCMFPQYFLNYMTTPFFILNTAYDVYQFHHALVPPSADMNGDWKGCKLSIASCTPQQLDILQGFRGDMLAALRSFFMDSTNGGMFINSCFGHCQSETQETWFALGSPIIQDKTIAGAVGDWYFSRNISKLIDCAYPCDASCHNIIAQVS